MNREAELANAKAAAEKLQDAAHGGTPVGIPGAFDPKEAPAPQQPARNASYERAIPESDDDRRDRELEGGGSG